MAVAEQSSLEREAQQRAAKRREKSRTVTTQNAPRVRDNLVGVLSQLRPADHLPAALRTAQLRLECRSLGLAEEGSDCGTLVAGLTAHDLELARGSGDPDGLFFDTGNAVTVLAGSQLVVSPEAGPAQVRVCFGGVEVDAFLSTASQFTVVSAAFAERAGIASSELETSAFVNFPTGAPFKKARRAPEVVVALGQVRVV